MIHLIPWRARRQLCIYPLLALLAACGPANVPAAPTTPTPASVPSGPTVLAHLPASDLDTPTVPASAASGPTVLARLPASDRDTPTALASAPATPVLATNPPASGAPPSQYAVLFDASHGETAGNADWVISTSQPDPLRERAAPQREADWTGAISAWGVALQRTGRYRLMTLAGGRPISYGDHSNPLDLANFNTFVVPEPNVRFSDAEKTAIMRFVQNGGGLFMIADHDQSDRNNDGMDSLRIWNDLMAKNSIQAGNPFGFHFDTLNIGTDNPHDIPASAANNPVIHGPFGDVSSSIIRNGTTVTTDPAADPAVQALLYRSHADTSGNTGVFFVTSTFGQGRVAAWGDSSAIDDGTGAKNEKLFDGWNDAGGSDAILALNATEWLAQGGASVPAATNIPAATVPAATTPVVAGPTQQTLVQNGDFEQGQTGWRVSSIDNRPLIGSERAHGGKQSAILCGTNNCKASLSQSIALPADTKTITLSYYTYIDTQETNHAFDFLDVEIRDSSGKKLKAIQRLSDGDLAGEWQQTSADLSEFAGQTVQLVFSATSGKTKPTAFFVDDVNVGVE